LERERDAESSRLWGESKRALDLLFDRMTN